MAELTGAIFHLRPSPDLDPSQFRAARAMLGWSLVDMAQRSRTSVSTVLDVEGRGDRAPPPRSADAMRAVLEAAGVRFLRDEGGNRGVQIDAP